LNEKMGKSSPSAFITGINGFAGSHLAEYLVGKGYRVGGITNNRGLDRNLRGLQGTVRVHYVDLGERGALERILGETRPDEVYHLAAVTASSREEADPGLLFKVNVVGTKALLGAVKERSPRARVLNVGSSSQYGDRSIDVLDEGAPFQPRSLYSVSKAAQEMVALSFQREEELDVICARAFNHTGPRESPAMACSQFAMQIAEVKLGMREPVVSVGDLSGYRDLSDVRDVVRAYHAVASSGKPGEAYNVCSGRAIQMRKVLEILLGIAGVEVEVRENAGRSGRSDISFQCGSSRKLEGLTGWKPEIPIERTLGDLLDFWIQELSHRRVVEG